MTDGLPEQDGREARDAAMQRVRVGVTGLAAVFLLTLLAASLLTLFGQDGRSAGRGGAVANVASGDDAPKEPLAELGVAPGNAPRTPPPPPPTRHPVRTTH